MTFAKGLLSVLSPTVQAKQSEKNTRIEVKNQYKPSRPKGDPIVEEMVSSIRSMDSVTNFITLTSALGTVVGTDILGGLNMLSTMSYWGVLRALPNGVRAFGECAHGQQSMMGGVEDMLYEIGSMMGVMKDWDPQKNFLKYSENQNSIDKTSLWDRVRYASTIPLITLVGVYAAAAWQGTGAWAAFKGDIGCAMDLSKKMSPTNTPSLLAMGALSLVGAFELLRGVSRFGSWVGNQASGMARHMRAVRLSQAQRTALPLQDSPKKITDPSRKKITNNAINNNTSVSKKGTNACKTQPQD